MVKYTENNRYFVPEPRIGKLLLRGSDCGVPATYESVTNNILKMTLIANILIIAGIVSLTRPVKTLLETLMATELAYIGLALRFFQTSWVFDSGVGLVTGMSLLVLAACESAVFLSILVKLHLHGDSSIISKNSEPTI